MNKIKEFRAKLEISQEYVAREANISLRHFQRIEKGEQVPSVYIAIDIAKSLKTTVEIIFNRVSKS